MMTENPMPDKENIIKDIINLFKTKKEKKIHCNYKYKKFS